MSDTEPIVLRPRPAGGTSQTTHDTGHASPPGQRGAGATAFPQTVRFNRQELSEILNVYGRMVAAGEWRDYAIDMGRETAAFSVYRRTSEFPLYRIVKNPKLAKKQGAFSVVTATGLILKRGSELSRVLGVFDASLKLVKA